MGIEPTQGSVSLPHNGFEDRTPHQQRSVPTNDHNRQEMIGHYDRILRQDLAFDDPPRCSTGA